MRRIPGDYFNPTRNLEDATAGDKRLVFASFPVSILFSVFYILNSAPDLAPFLLLNESARMERQAREDKVYPYLVEQEYKVKKVTDQISALSDTDAEGRGGITKKYGFHTLSPEDELRFASSGERGSSSVNESFVDKIITKTGQLFYKNSPAPSGEKSPSQGKESNYRIPANYRFRNDFALRYDNSDVVSIARKELAGFKFFQGMLRQIRYNFSPPGLNFAYRDASGTVINQPIKPQVVSVQFLLDEAGTVRDVRLISSMRQSAVDQACIEVLLNKNFGMPPAEIFREGNIFGLNFIFPRIH
jgi:hypothetical protein